MIKTVIVIFALLLPVIGWNNPALGQQLTKLNPRV
jgi:hypothetical protein